MKAKIQRRINFFSCELILFETRRQTKQNSSMQMLIAFPSSFILSFRVQRSGHFAFFGCRRALRCAHSRFCARASNRLRAIANMLQLIILGCVAYEVYRCVCNFKHKIVCMRCAVCSLAYGTGAANAVVADAADAVKPATPKTAKSKRDIIAITPPALDNERSSVRTARATTPQ